MILQEKTEKYLCWENISSTRVRNENFPRTDTFCRRKLRTRMLPRTVSTPCIHPGSFWRPPNNSCRSCSAPFQPRIRISSCRCRYYPRHASIPAFSCTTHCTLQTRLHSKRTNNCNITFANDFAKSRKKNYKKMVLRIMKE